MKIVFASQTVIDDLSAGTKLFHDSLSINGVRVLDEAQIIRATNPRLYDRGNRKTILGFRSWRYYADNATAQNAALTANSAWPTAGAVVITCGEGTETRQTVNCASAFLTIQVLQLVGSSVQYAFSLTCVDLIPTTPNPDIVPTTGFTVLANQLAIPNATSSQAVTFGTPFTGGGLPTVLQDLASAIAADPAIKSTLREGSVSNSGFTVDLAAPTGNANYVLNWAAFK